MRELKICRLTGMALLCLLLSCSFFSPAFADTVYDTVHDYSTSFDDLQRQEREGRRESQSTPPLCNDPSCKHVKFDANQQPIKALCALGAWLMSGDPNMTLFNADPYDFKLTGGDNFIDHDGVFDLTGGDGTTRLVVRAGYNATLQLNGAQIQTLQVNEGATASVTLNDSAESSAQSSVNTILANPGAVTLQLNGVHVGMLELKNGSIANLVQNGASVGTLRSNGGTLRIRGSQRFTTIEGSGVTLTGDGTARVTNLNAPISPNSRGSFQLIYTNGSSEAFQKLQPVTATTGKFSGAMTVTYDGAQMARRTFSASEPTLSNAALIFADTGEAIIAYSPLPTLEGQRYEAIVDNLKSLCRIRGVTPLTKIEVIAYERDQDEIKITVETNVPAELIAVQYKIMQAEHVVDRAIDIPVISKKFMDDAIIVQQKPTGVTHTFIIREPAGRLVSLRAFATHLSGKPFNKDNEADFICTDPQTDVRKILAVPAQEKSYDGRPLDLVQQKLVRSDLSIVYYRKRLPRNDEEEAKKEADGYFYEKLREAPLRVGEYVANITIADNDPEYMPIPATKPLLVLMKITKKKVLVYAMPDQRKTHGKPDPVLEVDLDKTEWQLFEGDVLVGELSRRSGESYGNYAYGIGSVHAINEDGEESHDYEFEMAPNSPYFFIDWNTDDLIYDPRNRIDPVFDEVHLGNGKVLKVQRRTSDVISLGSTYFGTLVTDTLDNRGRPFTPSLRLRQGEDQILLIMTAESELREDGGYDTDRDGNRIWRGRRLTLGNWHIIHLRRNYISDISFSLGGTSLMFPLNVLTGDEMDALLKQNGLGRANTYYCFELVPVLRTDALLPGEADAARLVGDGEMLMRVSAYLRNGDTRVDISPLLREAKLIKDIDHLLVAGEAATQAPADITETVGGKPVQAQAPAQAEGDVEKIAAHNALNSNESTEEMLELAYRLLTEELSRRAYALQKFADGLASTLDSGVVVPYTASEKKNMLYTALMRTRPFLIAAYGGGGLYGLGAP